MFSLRYILVGNHNGLEKVIKNSKRLGVQTILEEIYDLDWECFKEKFFKSISSSFSYSSYNDFTLLTETYLQE